MRGKVISTRIASVKVRITPAYAGKSLRACSHKLLPEDHPRLCGEKVPEMLQFSSVAGSPPPMRGKDTPKSVTTVPDGITPAYAGKRTVSGVPALAAGDHPRLCGEKRLAAIQTDGSLRITPAYAGKSKSRRWEEFVKRDHPRLCGEKTANLGKECYALGSPPPMRGKVRLLYHRGESFRITPAYAGKRMDVPEAARSM